MSAPADRSEEKGHEQQIRLLEARLHAQERALADQRRWTWVFMAVIVGTFVLWLVLR